MNSRQRGYNIITISLLELIISIMIFLYISKIDYIFEQSGLIINLLDILGCAGLIFGINLYFKEDYLNRNRKKISRILIAIVVIYFFFGLNTLSEVISFKTPINMCYFREDCYYNFLMYYPDEKYAVITHPDHGTFYYVKDNGKWSASSKISLEKYYYEDENLQIKIYTLKDEYFVIVNTKDNKAHEIIDNKDNEFKSLSTLQNKDILIKNYYGKIVNNIENYEIKIDGTVKELNKTTI